MNCPQCGELCRCQLEPLLPVSSQWEPDVVFDSSSVAALETACDPEVRQSSSADQVEAESPATNGDSTDAPAWRDELSARLNRYRARRKAPPPRYPSLRLQFEMPALPTGASTPPMAAFESVSNHALALDGMRHVPSATLETDVQSQHENEMEPAREPVRQRPASAGAKIIEFPGFSWGPPAAPPDQLAEPVGGRPRILEVPETAPPPPALGGITIEAIEHPEAEKRPGIDIPLQSAPPARRVIAALLDGIIIAAASGVFGYIFWKVTAAHPPLVQLFGLAAGIPCTFWAAYQYLLIVYGGSTPGLRVAGLELARFDGTSTTRSLRRWRVLASFLSAVSAGMGYVWLFLDEDALCWHDRITHTYLAPKRRESVAPGDSSD